MIYRLLCVGFVCALSSTCSAIDWSGTSSQDWSDGSNWYGSAKPMSNDPVSGDDATIDVDFFENFPIISTPDELARSVYVGNSLPGDLEIVSGGGLSALEMNIGQDFGALGNLEFSGGTLNLSQDLNVGVGEFGVVNQTGGSIESVRNVIVGVDSFGSYFLESGSVNVTVEDFIVSFNVDSAGSSFSQEAGDVVARDLSIGHNVESDGTVSLSNGTITLSRNLVVGREGTGSFIQEGGTVSVGNDLLAGAESDSGEGNGTYNQTAGMLEVTNHLKVGVNGSGMINLSGGNIHIGQDFQLGLDQSANGTVTLNGGATTVDGDLVLTADSVSSSASFTLQDGVLDLTGGDVVFNSGITSFAFDGGRLEDVRVFGNSLINNGGTIAPGGSVGTTTVAGDYTQTALGTIEVDVSGDTEIADRIDVQDAVTLDGALTVNILSRFNTIKDHSFVILTAPAGVTGNFSTVPEIANGRGAGHLQDGVFFQGVWIDATDVGIDLFQALEGDGDGDADVDITDFNVLATQFDPNGVNSDINDWTRGNFDGDGDVDITDFNFMAVNFSDDGYGATISFVPEPTTALLLMLGVVFGCVCRRQME